jgi:transposase
MTLVGCDLHTRKQQVAVLDTETGEMYERQLSHAGEAVEQFYRTLPGPVTVGIESTGYALWFHELMQRLGHTLLVGEAAKIRAIVVRKTSFSMAFAVDAARSPSRSATVTAAPASASMAAMPAPIPAPAPVTMATLPISS